MTTLKYNNTLDISNIGNVIFTNNYYDLYQITNYRKFVTNIDVWKENRLVSKKRVEKIKNAIINKDIIHSTLYVSEIIKNNNKKYYLWDGQHRFLAIKECCSIYEDISFIDNIFFCIIYKNDTKNNMKKKFININKAIPVPSYYIDQLLDDNKKLKLKENTEWLCKKIRETFKENESSSRNAKKPNYNSDIINEKIFDFFQKKKLYNFDKDLLWNQILLLNETLKDTLILTNYVKIKANKYNCFLFCTEKFFMEELDIEDITLKDNNIDI